MLTKDEILEKFNKDADFFRREYSVSKLGLFGSFVRGEATDKSDVDVLVSLSEPTFDHYMGFKFYLEKIFNRDVDLVMDGAVKPRLRPYIEREVEYAKGF
jgi:uncharacterized protein